MKLNHNIAIAILAASFILNSANISAFAAPNAENETGFSVKELTPVDLSNVDPSNIIELPQPEAMAKKSEPSPELASDLEAPDISLSDLESVKSLDDSLTKGGNESRAGASYEIATISDVMPSGTSGQLYNITVGSGGILQVELQVPKNSSLDYDLYLYELDAVSGGLIMVSGSEYATDSVYMPESAGAINNSGSALTYYILVDSKGNPSTTDYYTINASVGINYESDPFEPNESAFFSVEFPTLTSGTEVTVSGGLNTPIDNDWFSLYIESTSAFAGIDLIGIPDSVIVESYTVSGGNQMIKKGSTLNGSILPIVKGYNYFRIISDRKGAFTPGDYKITFSPALTATKMYTLIAVNGYCQRTSNLFDDGLTRYLFVLSSDVEVKTQYLTSNNIPAKASDTVHVEIYNPAWDNPFMQYEKGDKTVANAYSCSVLLRGPTLCDEKLDFVYTTITSQKFGTIADGIQMALLNKYDDGELNRPCIHNGSCGFR